MSTVPVGPDSGGRIKGETIIKPIVVGNIARYFGKKREEDGHTHQWTIYLKPYENEDYSPFIKKVHFKLHDSYANPNRILTKPPYEVTETGWGEFEIMIKIYFVDPIERPVSVYHILKLFQMGSDPANPVPTVKKTIISEVYDELIFQDPTPLMKTLLDDVPIYNEPYKHDVDFEEKKAFAVEQITAAKLKVKSEIQDMKEKLTLARETIDQYKEKIRIAQNQENTGENDQNQDSSHNTSITISDMEIVEPTPGCSKDIVN